VAAYPESDLAEERAARKDAKMLRKALRELSLEGYAATPALLEIVLTVQTHTDIIQSQ
jgi:hypothetical protein